MSRNLKRTKFLFITALLIIVVGLIYGVLNLDGSYYWQKNFAVMQIDFMRVKSKLLLHNMGFWQSENTSLKASEGDMFAQSVPILLYHGIIKDSNWKPDQVNTRYEDFEEQMITLKSLGYETVTLNDFLAFSRGEKNLPEKSFLLTFDDGRKDSYYPVDPILKALDYHAVMFVIAGRSLGQDEQANTFHLNKGELRKMVASGRWDIGSHTQNGHDMERIDANGNTGHFLTNKIWLKYEGRMETDAEFQKRLENDLLGSKNDLENKLGIKVKTFAYPFGDYGVAENNYTESRKVLANATRNIFPYTFYQARGSDFIGNYPQNSLMFRRLSVDSSISANKLATLLLNSRAKPADSFQDNFVTDKGWLEGWGKREFNSGLMLAGPTNSEDSSLTFLDGSYTWKDYFFQSKVQLLKGKSFALLSRYQSSSSYISCDFSETNVSINEFRDGVEHTLSEVPFSTNIFSKETLVGMDVKGQEIGCYVEGKKVSVAFASPNLSNGGIGFKTWDSKIFNSELRISNVEMKGKGIPNHSTFKGLLSGL